MARDLGQYSLLACLPFPSLIYTQEVSEGQGKGQSMAKVGKALHGGGEMGSTFTLYYCNSQLQYYNRHQGCNWRGWRGFRVNSGLNSYYCNPCSWYPRISLRWVKCFYLTFSIELTVVSKSEWHTRDFMGGFNNLLRQSVDPNLHFHKQAVRRFYFLGTASAKSKGQMLSWEMNVIQFSTTINSSTSAKVLGYKNPRSGEKEFCHDTFIYHSQTSSDLQLNLKDSELQRRH